jgi:hypothetical protein
MTHAQQSELRPTTPLAWGWAVPRVAANKRAFWALLIAELALVLGVLWWVVSSLPSAQAPLAAVDERQQVLSAVYERVGGLVPDRLVAVAPGVLARESNVRGFVLNNRVYYYQTLNEPSFDPLSLGAIELGQVEVVYDVAQSPRPLRVYTILAP